MTASDKDMALAKLRAHLPNADERLFAFFAAWVDARGDALVPARKAFSPVTIPELLSFIWIYKFDPEQDDFICQLAGETVNDAWGKSIRGRRLREIVGEKDFPTVRTRWATIVGRPAALYGTVEEKLAFQATWQAERLLLPMSSEDGTIDVIIGLSLYTLQRRATDEKLGVSGRTMHFPCTDFRPCSVSC
ncbi:PAS domain-containing protein [uncultured Nisaea sp.]|uniref:PAS domain-containing protein n=1 Tax=uncultured Nisaea sp. TaxID=538215 RepID=UPI0030EF2C5F|tara:strand:+ start:1638 stop:2207 length:570 start_codon:yes stop_codon:yes gene_type:complete